MARPARLATMLCAVALALVTSGCMPAAGPPAVASSEPTAQGATSTPATSGTGESRPATADPTGDLVEGLTAPKRRTFTVSKSGSSYRAAASPGHKVYRGSLKTVMQSAARYLQQRGGGTVRFTAGTFDFGSQYYLGVNVRNIAFVGAGMRKTTLRNSTDADEDTEPFNFAGAFGVRIRDMTVFAGGSPRTTSDALDFDNGNRVVVERVRVTGSRGRGIVFDGKDADASADNNRVTDCVIRRTDGHGIELLAASRNVIEGCKINRVGRSGISIIKASPTAVQANKKSSHNLIRRNRINQSGEHGILLLSGDRNRLVKNVVKNSSHLVEHKDGIRIGDMDSVTCDRNVVRGNTATDTQSPKTQFYGLWIISPLCHRTLVVGNQLAGNAEGALRDDGTGTIRR